MNSRFKIQPEALTKTILSLAWPTIVAMLIQTSFNIIDTIFVGRLSPQALAAVSLSFPIMFFVLALGNGIGVGSTSLISRALGRNRKSILRDSVLTSIWLSIFVGIFATFSVLFFGRWLVSLMTHDKTVLFLAWQFLRVYSFSLFFITVGLVINSIFRAQGDMKTPMVIMVIAALINIALDPLFIFGTGFFPRLGVTGAALATLIARIVSVIVAIILILVKEKDIIFPLKFVIRKSIFREVIKVGIPSSFNQMAGAITLLFLNGFVSYFGAYALAAFAVVFRVESIAYLPAIAISNTIIPLVGHTVGQNSLKLAKKISSLSSRINMIIMVSVGILFFIFAKEIIMIFSSDPRVVSIGTTYFKIVPLEYLFVGVMMAKISSFQGAGNALPSMVLNVVRGFVLLIPLAFVLSRDTRLGIIGIWVAMIVSSILSFAGAEIWFWLRFDKNAIKGLASIDKV